MTQHSGTLYLEDTDYEAPAIYDIAATWVQGDAIVTGWRLASWMFGDREQTRETAVKLLGEDEVHRQERTAASEWLRTARRDMADDHADSRRWLAAE